MEKIDLFETLVRFLSVKPIPFESFDLAKAESTIKAAKRDQIFFVGDHAHFEDILDMVSKKITTSADKNLGIVYINIKGGSCTERLKRVIMDMAMSVRTVIIFGTSQEWLFLDKLNDKVQFSQSEDQFEDNHQRFFIYHSPSYSAGLVARHNSENQIESAISNDPEAVSLLSQTVGMRVYKKS